jgi:[ribosomal protein S5]-alanine N-acetyltransferase
VWPAPTLTGERVTLRAMCPDDADDVLDISVYDGVHAVSVAEARSMLTRIDADAARGDTVHWGICQAGSDTVVGTIGFYRGFADAQGEVGYVLRAPFRRRGLMREALALVVAFGFERLGSRRSSRVPPPTTRRPSGCCAVSGSSRALRMKRSRASCCGRIATFAPSSRAAEPRRTGRPHHAPSASRTRCATPTACVHAASRSAGMASGASGAGAAPGPAPGAHLRRTA